MTKFVSFSKRSKKTQKEVNSMKRGDWGLVKPTTSRKESNKKYSRQKSKKLCREVSYY